MRVLDLFSGIGGFSLGLHRAGGFETVAFCDSDGFARSITSQHWPGVPHFDDVRTAEFPAADVLTAGFPCQDISRAGPGAGLAGEFSGLFGEVVRAIRMVRPRFVILENVAMLLHRGMGDVLGAMAESGYDAEWDCLPAWAVGAPHRRDRLWIVAHAAGERDGFSPGQVSPGWDFTLDGARWRSEPDVGRVADGVPERVDRLRTLGNSIVPQIAELFGRAIMRHVTPRKER